MDYRVLVVGDKAPAVMERIPAHVVGDGINTIRQLITKFNQNPLVGHKYEKPMCKIKLNGEIKRILKKKGINLGYIPEVNEQVFLRQNANISTGGIGKDATQEAPNIVKSTAITAARAIGMQITGVDILYDKLAQKAYVLELNDQPGIDIHHFPIIGQSQNI
jgi:D-alanine-D-alanine ligase-like ATP-grasp enzyme